MTVRVVHAPRSRMRRPLFDTSTIVPPRRERTKAPTMVVSGSEPENKARNPRNAQPTTSGALDSLEEGRERRADREDDANRNQGRAQDERVLATDGMTILTPPISRVTSLRASGGRGASLMHGRVLSAHADAARDRRRWGSASPNGPLTQSLDLQVQMLGDRLGTCALVAHWSRLHNRRSGPLRDFKVSGNDSAESESPWTKRQRDHGIPLERDAVPAQRNQQAPLLDDFTLRTIDGHPAAAENQRSADSRKGDRHQDQQGPHEGRQVALVCSSARRPEGPGLEILPLRKKGGRRPKPAAAFLNLQTVGCDVLDRHCLSAVGGGASLGLYGAAGILPARGSRLQPEGTSIRSSSWNRFKLESSVAAAYDMAEVTDRKEVTVKTPFGEPSGAYVIGTLRGKRVAFLSRHGAGHRISPSELNFRANIFGMKLLGRRVHSVRQRRRQSQERIHAAGHRHPGPVHRSHARAREHVLRPGPSGARRVRPSVLQDPQRGRIRERKGGRRDDSQGGTYVCMEGPQFSTLAESNLYRGGGRPTSSA